MKLYFLRHATASEIAVSDAERELTKEGEQEAHIAGAALVELGVKPAHVLSSPLLRTCRTAEIAAKELKFSSDVELIDELKNDTSTNALVKRLKSCGRPNEILLVGHMPSLSVHIAALIGAQRAQGLPLGTASVACVELPDLRMGTGQLRWLMQQKQLRKIAR